MKRITVAALAVGAVALSGLAVADTTAKSNNFHGVRILDGITGENSGGRAEAITHVFGPYDTDAVVFLNWTGEIAYTAPHGVFEPRVALSYDGAIAEAKNAKTTMNSDEPSRYRVMSADRLFLAKGLSRTVAVEVGDQAAPAASKPAAIARLQGFAIATRE